MKKYKIEFLNKFHHKAGFNCVEESLNNYLHKQASQDIKRNLAAVYVLTELDNPTLIHGFYTLSSSAIPLINLPETLSKKLPRYPLIPVTLLGRLAINQASQKQGFGEILLMDALRKAAFLSEKIGSMAVVVDALNEQAIRFYEKYGFIKFKDENKLFLTIDTINKAYA